MWAYPRMVAWFLASAAALLLARLPFMRAEMIPHHVKFDPGVALVPVAGILWGPAGAWAGLAASLIGDKLTGLWGPLTPFRAAGCFLLAWSAQRLWDAVPGAKEPSSSHTADVGSTLRFLFVAWTACFIDAAWVAFGIEAQGLYPFPYIVSLVLLHNLVLVTLFGPPVYRWAARALAPHFGSWRAVMGDDAGPGTTMRSTLGIFVGGIGAAAAGAMAGFTFYRIAPLVPYVLGTACGAWVEVLSLPFLALQLASVLGIAFRRRPAEPRFTDEAWG